MTKIAALVPLKLNSRRLPNKNFLRLGDYPLAYHIFKTLLNVESIDNVYCFSSQSQILSLLPDGVDFLVRPSSLDSDDVKANELFFYAIDNIDADWIVLCHATAPFITARSIEQGLDKVLTQDYDCAFTVMRHQTYCWYEGKPLNYHPSKMAQTQDLSPVYSETSGFYIFRKIDYLKNNTRICGRPFFVEVDEREAIDIDEPKDFNFATHMLNYDPNSLTFSNDRFFVDQANMANPHKSVQHVSFDLDGVLIDSLELMENAWYEATKNLNIGVPFSEYKHLIGIPFDQILTGLGVHADYHHQITTDYSEFSKSNESLIKLYPGVVSSLKCLVDSGIKISLVTSKDRTRTMRIVDRFFSDVQFSSIVCPEDIPSSRGKPHPDPLLLACIQVGVDPYYTIYIGDMKPDYLAAKASGIHFVHANWGYGDLSGVKGVWFNSISDLTSYLTE